MKSGKQRRAELKTKRKQREAKQRSLAAGPRATPRPLGTAPVNEALLAPAKAMARLTTLCAVTIKTYPSVAKDAVKMKFGLPRSRSGGMKRRKATSIPRRNSVDRAARRNRRDAQRRDGSIWKEWPVRRPHAEVIRMIGRLFFIVLLFLCVLGTPLHGADGDLQQRQLIEAAKKEGKLVFYTSVETEFARSLAAAFEAKYSFIKTDIFRSTHDKIVSRMNVERKTGTYTADTMSVGEFETYHMQKMGFITPYKSPFAATYPEGFKDPNGYWTDLYDNLIVMAYNTKRVKRDELPKRYEDLLHSRWKGRMVLDQNEDRWFANMLYLMGEQKGMEFMQALAKQEVSIRSGRGMVTQLLGAGEYDLQIVAYWYRPHLMKKQGAPVDWIAFEPAIVATHPISVVNRAPHLNAAKLFIDFAISDEGQKIFVQRGRESAKPGLKPEGYPGHLKVIPSRVQLAEKLEEYSRRYRELFVR
jgi:iron(III) transport system substrate-binding protein